MPEIELNPVAIAVATLVSAALGAAWYSPVILGKQWMSALGKTQDQLGPPGPAMVGSVVSCLVAAASVDFLVAATGATSALAGAGIGFVLGLGVVAMTMLSDSLFSGWGWRLYFIQVGYRTAYLILMGAICGGWRA